MPKVDRGEVVACPPVRLLTGDELGLLKVVSLGQNRGTGAGGSAGPQAGASGSGTGSAQSVVRFGEADKSRAAVCCSACVAVDERSSIVAVARKHGMVDVLLLTTPAAVAPSAVEAPASGAAAAPAAAEGGDGGAPTAPPTSTSPQVRLLLSFPAWQGCMQGDGRAVQSDSQCREGEGGQGGGEQADGEGREAGGAGGERQWGLADPSLDGACCSLALMPQPTSHGATSAHGTPPQDAVTSGPSSLSGEAQGEDSEEQERPSRQAWVLVSASHNGLVCVREVAVVCRPDSRASEGVGRGERAGARDDELEEGEEVSEDEDEGGGEGGVKEQGEGAEWEGEWGQRLVRRFVAIAPHKPSRKKKRKQQEGAESCVDGTTGAGGSSGSGAAPAANGGGAAAAPAASSATAGGPERPRLLCGAVDPSAATIAVGGKAADLTVWDLRTGALTWEARLPLPSPYGVVAPKHVTAVCHVSAAHPARIVTACLDNSLRVFDLLLQPRPLRVVSLGTVPIRSLTALWSSGGGECSAVVVGTGMGEMKLVDLQHGE
ncbi:hypothetical protein CLOM_g13512 [Closterium sp. NIES-68]|nr:hypothetical protein CLOM_g13512 [Closterium sp. NIES-68]GJP78640.1 hypothetical protein CLOP_g8917 [Closterium sp. NIES-67]